MSLKDDLYQRIVDVLVDEFDIDRDEITPESRLVEDLELDSIDAAEMIVKFREYLPPKVDAGMFREIRTLQDLVELLVADSEK